MNACAILAALGACFGLLLPSTARATLSCSDEALSEAASLLLVESPSLSASDIASALQRARSDAPTGHALRIGVNRDADVEAWLAELGRRNDAPIVCGRATNTAFQVVVARENAGALTAVSHPGTRRFEVAVHTPYHDARVVVLDAQRQSHDLVVTIERGRSYVDLPESLGPTFLLQLSATGPHGPKPIAERRVGDLASMRSANAASTSVLDRANDARTAAGRGPLRVNRILSEAATQHATSVCELGLVAHTLEVGADPESRLRARGVVARVVGESIARAADAQAGFDAMLASPSHAATITDERFTDIGSGTAQDRHNRTCLVVLLAAWPRIVPAGTP